MRSDPESTVDGVYRAWMLRDRDAMLAYFTDDAWVVQHVSQDSLPFAGESIGKGLLSERIDQIFRDWDFERIKLASLSIEGDPGSVMQPGGPATLPVRFELERMAAPAS